MGGDSETLEAVFYFFAMQDIVRNRRDTQKWSDDYCTRTRTRTGKVKDDFLTISRRSFVAMAPCQR